MPGGKDFFPTLFKLGRQLRPFPFVPTVNPHKPSRSPRIDPTVKGFVAVAHLLPFQLRKAALRLDGHKLFGGQLLDPFRRRPGGKVNEPGRIDDAFLKVFVGRRDQPQEALGFRLEDGGRNVPKLDAPPKLAPAFGHFDITWPVDRGRTVEAFPALDCDNLTLASRPNP